MKVKQLHLQNYGRFEDLTIDFAPLNEKQKNVTVIVGNNGAGKSQILQALSTGFSWFIADLIKNTQLAIDINKKAILNGKDESTISIEIYKHFKSTKFSSTSTSGGIGMFGFDKNYYDDFITPYHIGIEQKSGKSLPLIIFYPVERTISGEYHANIIELEDSQITAYESALNKLKIDFNIFFQWFRKQEDIENEMKSHQISIFSDLQDMMNLKSTVSRLKIEETNLQVLLETSNELEKSDICIKLGKLKEKIFLKEKKFTELSAETGVIHFKENLSLKFVRHAIEYFTDFKNPRIRRQGTPTMIVDKLGKNGKFEELDVNQLSQGEKSLLALVGDIARRLAILNPSLDNPLEGEGVVMIDEVDLHLHPKWQHDLIDKLVRTFPNVQFILTTHSPHIISDNPDILVYALNDGELSQVPNVYGEDVNTVLTKVFDVDIRDSKVQEPLDDIRRAISHKEFEVAKTKIDELAKILPIGHMELLKSRLMLAQAQLAEK